MYPSYRSITMRPAFETDGASGPGKKFRLLQWACSELQTSEAVETTRFVIPRYHRLQYDALHNLTHS